MENFEEIKKVREEENIPMIDDLDEAREYIEEMLERGERPIVSVPAEYAGHLKNGLKKHASWIPSLEVLAGTLGREPYSGSEKEERVYARINNIEANYMEPRVTGPDKSFHGIVVFKGPIPPEAIEIIK